MTTKTRNRTPRVYAVLGYGCHLTPAVRRYLDRAGERVVAELKKEPTQEALLFCSGGFTMHKSAPGISEARLMANYLRRRGLDLPTVLDEKALTTLENLRHLTALCEARGVSAQEVVICCDETRRAKITHVTRHLLGEGPVLWTYDLGRNRRQAALQQTLGLAYDALALRVRLIERLGLAVIGLRNAQA